MIDDGPERARSCRKGCTVHVTVILLELSTYSVLQYDGTTTTVVLYYFILCLFPCSTSLLAALLLENDADTTTNSINRALIVLDSGARAAQRQRRNSITQAAVILLCFIMPEARLPVNIFSRHSSLLLEERSTVASFTAPRTTTKKYSRDVQQLPRSTR